MPLLFRRHPQLRRRLFAGVFLSPSHAWVLLAVIGPLLIRRPWGLATTLPLAVFHVGWVRRDPRVWGRQLIGLPSWLLTDLAETIATVRSAIRHRVFVI